jgi:hypothetical protein
MPLVSVYIDQERLDSAARLAGLQHRRTRDQLAFLLDRAIRAAERAQQRSARTVDNDDVRGGPALVRVR